MTTPFDNFFSQEALEKQEQRPKTRQEIVDQEVMVNWSSKHIWGMTITDEDEGGYYSGVPDAIPEDYAEACLAEAKKATTTTQRIGDGLTIHFDDQGNTMLSGGRGMVDIPWEDLVETANALLAQHARTSPPVTGRGDASTLHRDNPGIARNQKQNQEAFDFAMNAYDRTVFGSEQKFVRPQQKNFLSPEELKVERDAAAYRRSYDLLLTTRKENVGAAHVK
jgi:hypothetical protein